MTVWSVFSPSGDKQQMFSRDEILDAKFRLRRLWKEFELTTMRHEKLKDLRVYHDSSSGKLSLSLLQQLLRYFGLDGAEKNLSDDVMSTQVSMLTS